MKWLVSGLIGMVLAGLFWLVWQDGQRQPGGFLFAMPSRAAEAGYCLAAAERAQVLIAARRPGARSALNSEQVEFWRLRTHGKGQAGAQALAAAVGAAPDETALLGEVLMACANRAVRLYGHRFASLE